MGKEKRLKERIERHNQEEELFKAVTLKDMVCQNCAFAYENKQQVSTCLQYPDMKPGKVIYGGACAKFEQK